MIPETWNKATIGELCQMVKGKAPIMKTKPGDYPLVTMGEEHKTADKYELDTEAVCVPMISSFGHGKPGLKRVHYIKGKFALSNILTALIVKDPNKLSTKYLALYLQTFKDQLIVPLQTGAANMSLRPDKLAGVPVHFPTLKEQECIVQLIDDASLLCRLRLQAQERLENLIPAIYFEMFGDPLQNSRKLPAKLLSELAETTSGGTPSRGNPKYYGGDIPWVKSGELHQSVVSQTEESITDEGLRNSSAKLMPIGTILLALYGATVGAISVLGIEAATNQAICCITVGKEIDATYLVHYLKMMTPTLLAKRVGGAQPNISQQIVKNLSVPIPPISHQHVFASRVKEIIDIETYQSTSSQKIDDLYNAVVTNAFRGKL